MTAYGWTLIPEDELLAQVLEEVPIASTEAIIKKTITSIYNEVMYQACQRVEQQGQAYRELHRYLYRVAVRRWPDMRPEELAQDAIILVHKQINRCHKPRAFLTFAFWKLRQVLKTKKNDRERLDKQDSVDEHIQLEDSKQLPFKQVLSKEKIEVLLKRIEHKLDERQREVIIWKFIGGLRDEEIAERLQIKPGYVRTIRSRAIEKLRQDKQLRDYFDKEE